MIDEENEITLTGVINSITFRNSANGFCVLELNVAGELVTAVGVTQELVTGEELTLTGKWVNNQTFGQQFSFSKCVPAMPDTTAKMLRFLSGGAIKGVGPKMAAKIIDYFGDETPDILENRPERLAEIKGISARKAIEIGTDFKKNFAIRRMLIELESYGISPAECTEIYKFFGPNSVSAVKSNPYMLTEIIPSFQFSRAEDLAAAFHFSSDPILRNKAGVYNILRHNSVMEGHTCVPEDKLVAKACDFLGIVPEDALAACQALYESKRAVAIDLNGRRFSGMTDLYIAEKTIAQKMNFILKFPPAYLPIGEQEIAAIERKNGIEYAEKQKLAIITAVEKGLLVLTGGPGTGKTTTVRGIIDFFEAKGIDVVLCAPTGRAAKRLSEITDRDAKTVHRLLEVEYDAHDKPVFGRNKENPLKAGAIIIDEMSMVDAQLCASLFDAIPIGCRIVIVGDSDQLPSVGAGNVLNDIIGSGRVPVVCLNEIFRQARSSLIVMNAHALMNGTPLELNRTDSDFFVMRREYPREVSALICDLVAQRLPKAYKFDSFDDIQVLCPSKKGECGTVNVNLKLQKILNPYSPKKIQVKCPGERFLREGDKVIQTKNNYNLIWEKDGEEGEGIFNGDIGKIEKINVAGGFLRIRFDDRVTEYPVENVGDLDLAYAVTIHKSQGSEYPAVIIPVSDCPPMLMYRNLLYTAITRAKKILILCGDEYKIRQMAQDVSQSKRYSGLKYYLYE